VWESQAGGSFTVRRDTGMWSQLFITLVALSHRDEKCL
jgi:hypothetical protein